MVTKKFFGHAIVGATTLTVVAAANLAFAGNEGSGGGSEIESTFRLRASILIDEVAKSREADKLCSSENLRSSLDKTRIEIVEKLINPATHRPVSRSLDAWTSPGEIQLLRSSWVSYFDSSYIPSNGKSIDALILHEVYRATAGKCLDDRFVLTSRVLPLLEQPDPCTRIATEGAADMATPGFEPITSVSAGPIMTELNGQSIDVDVKTSTAEYKTTFQVQPIRGQNHLGGDCMVFPTHAKLAVPCTSGEFGVCWKVLW